MFSLTRLQSTNIKRNKMRIVFIIILLFLTIVFLSRNLFSSRGSIKKNIPNDKSNFPQEFYRTHIWYTPQTNAESTRKCLDRTHFFESEKWTFVSFIKRCYELSGVKSYLQIIELCHQTKVMQVRKIFYSLCRGCRRN